MTESNICTCPSGDGSLRWPCPKHPAVEHERAEFEAWVRRDWPGAPLRFIRDALPVNDPRYGQYCDDALQRAWVGWQARAALAQPSPALPPFAEKVLTKLRRFNECAEDPGSGGVDIGRHWLDLLTQLGLLNRVQRSPALWEISQQGEDLLGLDVPEIEVPDSMIEKAWQRFERTLQQLETPGQAEQAEQAEAERPEVVGSLYLGGWADQEELEDNDVELDMKVVERLQVDLASKGDGVHMPLMTVAQHERIVGALRFERQQMDRAFTACINERDAANARLHEVATACATAEQERDAALARVASLESKLAELEKQDLVDVPGPDEIHQMAFEEGQPADDGDGYLFSSEEFDLFVQRLLDSCATPVAWAQHSVPDGAADLCRFLAKLYCELDGLRYSTAKLPAEQIADALIFKWPVLQGARNQLNIKRISEQPYDESKLHSAIAAMLAAAPGKEVGHE